jgi:hypothetical protein
VDPSRYNGRTAKLHAGFAEAFESIRDKILVAFEHHAITQQRQHNKKITTLSFSGHSLGAVMAVYTSVWITQHVRADPKRFGFDDDVPPIRVITLGMPLNANEAFQQRLAEFFHLHEHRKSNGEKHNHFCHFLFTDDKMVQSAAMRIAFAQFTRTPGYV